MTAIPLAATVPVTTNNDTLDFSDREYSYRQPLSGYLVTAFAAVTGTALWHLGTALYDGDTNKALLAGGMGALSALALLPTIKANGSFNAAQQAKLEFFLPPRNSICKFNGEVKFSPNSKLESRALKTSAILMDTSEEDQPIAYNEEALVNGLCLLQQKELGGKLLKEFLPEDHLDFLVRNRIEAINAIRLAKQAVVADRTTEEIAQIFDLDDFYADPETRTLAPLIKLPAAGSITRETDIAALLNDIEEPGALRPVTPTP
ncbi:MAG: hypothetical protein GC136_00315 [Alphaproteobacteria bacterium]|nr:hypothetical protein [Alphaproteobacteria bacterium]